MNKSGYFQGFGIFLFPAPPYDRWCVGWLTGRDSDLVCIKPDIVDQIDGEINVSPICKSPLIAIWGFILKRLLSNVDKNMIYIKRLIDDNPNKESRN